MSFSIAFGFLHTLDVVLQNVAEWDLWFNGLVHLVRIAKGEDPEVAYAYCYCRCSRWPSLTVRARVLAASFGATGSPCRVRASTPTRSSSSWCR